MDNSTPQPQVQSQERARLVASWLESQTRPSARAGGSSTQVPPPAITDSLQPARPQAPVHPVIAGQALGILVYQPQFQNSQVQFEYAQPLNFEHLRAAQRYRDEQARICHYEWQQYCHQIFQDLQPDEAPAYADPQEYAVPLQPRGQRQDERQHDSIEWQTNWEAGDSQENPICLNEDSVDEQPAAPQPVIPKPALPVRKEKSKGFLEEFTEVTKRMEDGDWEGLDELQNLFRSLQRLWPGKYDCMNQRWYVKKEDPALFQCIARNGAAVKRSWEMRELVRKALADESAQRDLAKANRERGLVAPKPTNKTAEKKRKRTSGAESSCQPKAKQAKTTTKPKATKLKASSEPEAISRPKETSEHVAQPSPAAKTGTARYPAIFEEEEAALELVAQPATAAKNRPRYPSMFGEVEAAPKPVAQPAPALETGIVGPPKISEGKREAATSVDAQPAPPAKTGAAEAAPSAEAQASPDPTTEDHSVEMGGVVDTQVQGDNWMDVLFEEEGETAPGVEAQASQDPMAEEQAAQPSFEVGAEDRADDLDDKDSLLEAEEGEEAHRDQAAAKSPAEGPIENAPAEEDAAQVLEEHFARRFTSMRAPGEDVTAKFRAWVNLQHEADEEREFAVRTWMVPHCEADEESDVEQDTNEAPQQHEGATAEAEDGKLDDALAADLQAALEEMDAGEEPEKSEEEVEEHEEEFEEQMEIDEESEESEEE
ncbi:hypothetical protein HDK64DRAFT_304573 [Phyllosticta capitalensis]